MASKCDRGAALTYSGALGGFPIGAPLLVAGLCDWAPGMWIGPAILLAAFAAVIAGISLQRSCDCIISQIERDNRERYRQLKASGQIT